MAAHNRLIKGITADITGRADGHISHHAQAIHIWIQRTQTVGELLRKHRHYVIREVHGVTPAYCLFIQRRARAHVMRYIGYGHN